MISRYRNIIFCLLSIVANDLSAQEDRQKRIYEWNTPAWVRNIFDEQRLDTLYSISYQLNPFYLRGDFNGDGKADIAILVEEIKSGKKGIAVFHADKEQVFFLGAGTSIGSGGDDFKWMNAWGVYPEDSVSQGVGETTNPTLLGEALLVEKRGSASGIFYWNGKQYLWYQQGD